MNTRERVDVGASGVGTLVYWVYADRHTAATNAPHLYGGVPMPVPESQLYYWSEAWQEGEREALADIERGRTTEFDTPEAAVRWLLSGDDAD